MELHIQIKLHGDGFPTGEEFDTRVLLEDLLTDNNVGDVVGSGGGEGVMDLYVEVDDPTAARPRIQHWWISAA